MGNILLVDDEELVLKSIEKLLRKAGHEVVAVKTGREAIEKVEEGHFDLIVTDIRMPNLNGIEMIREIRKALKAKGRKPVPEVCITGYADNELNQRAAALGVVDYLYKPFDLGEFLNCVNRNLRT